MICQVIEKVMSDEYFIDFEIPSTKAIKTKTVEFVPMPLKSLRSESSNKLEIPKRKG